MLKINRKKKICTSLLWWIRFQSHRHLFTYLTLLIILNQYYYNIWEFWHQIFLNAEDFIQNLSIYIKVYTDTHKHMHTVLIHLNFTATMVFSLHSHAADVYSAACPGLVPMSQCFIRVSPDHGRKLGLWLQLQSRWLVKSVVYCGMF